MAKFRISVEDAKGSLFHGTAPKDVLITGAEVDNIKGELVLYLSGPSIPDADEVITASVQREEWGKTIWWMTEFVPKREPPV